MFIFTISRLAFAASTVFFGFFWGRGVELAATTIYGLRLFGSYLDAKNFLNRGTWISIIGFLLSLILENLFR